MDQLKKKKALNAKKKKKNRCKFTELCINIILVNNKRTGLHFGILIAVICFVCLLMFLFLGASRYSVGKMEPAQYGTVTGSAHSAHRPPMVSASIITVI